MNSIRNFSMNLQKQIHRTMRQYKHQKRLFQIKLFLLGILPPILLFLGVKGIKTWIRVQVRGIASAVSPAPISPIHQERIPNEFITPEPVGQTVSDTQTSSGSSVSASGL